MQSNNENANPTWTLCSLNSISSKNILIMNEQFTFKQELLDKVAKIPTVPGIYQYFNEQGKIIYIGKAKNLRNRVKSYFNASHSNNAKTQALIQKIADIEVIIVDSEAEALMLEDTLIKKHKPRYNIMLRDDKSYPYIRITNENFPRIFITRNVVKDGSKYLGPFTEVRSIKYLLTTVRNIFQIRSCKLNLTQENIRQNKFRSCLDFHIGKCQSPCLGTISKEEYNANVKMANQVLLGKTKHLANELEELMQKYSDNLEFEKAATVRNRLKSLGDFTAKQKVVSPELKDRDIFGIARNADSACTLVFIVREGKLIGKRHFLISKAGLDSDEEILQKTIEKYYLETDFVPKEIILPNEIEDLEYILDWLGKKKANPKFNYYYNSSDDNFDEHHHNSDEYHNNSDAENDGNMRSVSISIQLPKIGDKKKLVEMANTNAEFLLKEFILSAEKRDKIIPHSLIALQRDLNLTKPPRRIECYDNSHIQGSDMVSSLVVFIDGKPKKSEYRKFKAKESFNEENPAENPTVSQNDSTVKEFSTVKNPTVENSTLENFAVDTASLQFHNDDFAMMRETIERRFLRAIAENQELPDLVIVDGGKGQLSSAFAILKKLGLAEKVAIIGLAKRLEEVFKPDSNLPVLLPKTSSSLKLIQQLRDEAHRVANEFHRQLRSQRAIQSEILEIEGIGKITMRKLITKFGSVKGIKEATDNDLQEILNAKQFAALKQAFA